MKEVKKILSQLSLIEKISLLNKNIKGVERLGIPAITLFNESLHGVIRPGTATVFPQAIALAATWDTKLVKKVANAISDEARAKQNTISSETLLRFGSCLVFGAPVVNMARDPRWGRTQETYGEDPYLTSCIGDAYINGMQGNDEFYLKTACILKHFVANNEEHNRFECNAVISKKIFTNYYLKAFKACVIKSGTAGVMPAYNAVNGIPCHANRMLLENTLRGEWGFRGFTISDAGGIARLHQAHGYSNSLPQAAADALSAGVDLELDAAHIYPKHLPEAIQNGLIDEKYVDESATRVLTLLFRLGVMGKHEKNIYDNLDESIIGCEKHKKLALDCAAESIVLLKNNDCNGGKVLPLDMKKIKHITIVGKNANKTLFGHYSGIPVNPPISALNGIRKMVEGQCVVNYVEWDHYQSDTFEVMAGRLLSHPKPNGSQHECEEQWNFQTEFYNNEHFDGTPAISEDQVINFNWCWLVDPRVPGEKFSVRWTTCLTPKQSGTYDFQIDSAYSVKFKINEDTLLDISSSVDAIQKKVSITLHKGEIYKLVFEAKFISYEKRFACLRWRRPYDKSIGSFGAEVEAASKSDVVIAVIGLDNMIESEGLDRESLEISSEQVELVRKLVAVNPNTIVVTESGSPLAIPDIHDMVPAILHAWYPGEQGGNAIAEILFGKHNPSAKIPLTFYRSTDQLPPFDDYEITNGRTYMFLKEKPLYPFGHGLSYSDFEYKNLSVTTISDGNTSFVIKVDVKNISLTDGAEVVQLYVGETGSNIRYLCAFKKTMIAAGETKSLSFEMVLSEFLDLQNGKGDKITFYLASSSEDVRKKIDVTIGKQ